MARLSAELGCSPESLLDLDLLLFDATVSAVSDRVGRWGQVEELLAVNAELTHAVLVATIRANSKKPPQIEPLRIPRPGDREVEPKTVAPGDMARLMTGGEVTGG